MRKMSEICIFLSVFIAFVTTGYLWFTGQKDEALFKKVLDEKKKIIAKKLEAERLEGFLDNYEKYNK